MKANQNEKPLPDFKKFLEEQLYLDIKRIDEGTWTCIFPLAYTHAIITVKHNDFFSVGDRWCYHSYEAARAALDAWDGTGEPQGWHRHPATGRRREKDGTEYINF